MMDKLTHARSLLSAHQQVYRPAGKTCLSFGKLGLKGSENQISQDSHMKPGIHEFYGQIGHGGASLFAFLLAEQLAQTDDRTIFYIEARYSDHARSFSASLPDVLQNRLVTICTRELGDIFWCFEETLRSGQAACVICEVPFLNLTSSRRLQLACERGHSFGFALSQDSRGQKGSNGAQTCWHISGHAQNFWNIELLGGRGVRPYHWTVTYDRAAFSISVVPTIGNGPLYPDSRVA